MSGVIGSMHKTGRMLPEPAKPARKPRPPPPNPGTEPPCQAPEQHPRTLNLASEVSGKERSNKLTKFVCENVLPQCIKVTESYNVPGCDVKLEKGAILMLHYIFKNPTVFATNHMGKNVRLPVYARQNYEILPLDQALDDVEYDSTEELINAKPLPGAVRVLDAHCSCHPEEPQEPDDVIEIERVEVDRERGKVLVGTCDGVNLRYSTEMNTSRYTTMVSPDFHTMSELKERKFPQRVRVPDLGRGFSKRDMQSEKVFVLHKFSMENHLLATKYGDKRVYQIPLTTPLSFEPKAGTADIARALCPPMYALVNHSWGLVDPSQSTLPPSMEAIPQPLPPVLEAWLKSAEGKNMSATTADRRNKDLEEKVSEANKEMAQMKAELNALKRRRSPDAPAPPPRPAKEGLAPAQPTPPSLPPRPPTLRNLSTSDKGEYEQLQGDEVYEHVWDSQKSPKPSESMDPQTLTKHVNSVLATKEMELVDVRREAKFLAQKCEKLTKENRELKDKLSRSSGRYVNLPSRNPSKEGEEDDYEDSNEYLTPIIPEKRPLPIGSSSTLPRSTSRQDIESLSVDGVRNLLLKLGLEQYAQRFADEVVNGALLVHLGEKHFLELGMSAFHARKLKVKISGGLPAT
ncbi:uncharacterized protein [Diadema setosum]|uniref:uncharacterized protein n=1 Tax=Diadema setosum TaxID=31175 RepID=UPI003B3AA728